KQIANPPDAPPGLTEQWNGATWSVISDGFVGPSSATALSCTSSTSCFALNSFYFGQWNGTAWSAAPSQSTAQTPENLAVSCVDTTFCAAVGARFYSDFPTSTILRRTLARHWNGSVFVLLASPDPSCPPATELRAVACATATQC